MRIILSPAKKMNVDTDKLEYKGLPVFLEQTEKILDWLRSSPTLICRSSGAAMIRLRSRTMNV